MAILRPLVDAAGTAESEWVFTSDGKVAVNAGTLTRVVSAIAAAMNAAKESPALFRLSDMRRTVETLLAGMGVSQDVRAQIQSHGLGGVQARHYNRHDYRGEKRKALTAWARRVTTARPAAGAQVIEIGRSGRR